MAVKRRGSWQWLRVVPVLVAVATGLVALLPKAASFRQWFIDPGHVVLIGVVLVMINFVNEYVQIVGPGDADSRLWWSGVKTAMWRTAAVAVVVAIVLWFVWAVLVTS